ncbi:MAG: cytochrome c [Rhodobacteraceae bacterium]|nr:cytochrome c [Paracoccaceae bacterium]
MSPVRAALVVGTLALALSACTRPERPVDTGRAAYMEHCSSCHGKTARGDGPMAVLVTTGVPDLRQLAERIGGEFPKAYVIEIVTRISDLHDGIMAMPDFGALLGASPTVYTAPDGEQIQTYAVIVAIADYLESVQD